MERTVLDVLAFYQRELREHPDAAEALKTLKISPLAVEHFQLGYSSGKAFQVASKEQRRELRSLQLGSNAGDWCKNRIVVPVLNQSGALVDLCGLRWYASSRKLGIKNWQNPRRGLIGMNVLAASCEVILADHPIHALHAVGLGHLNVVALRGLGELESCIPVLVAHDIRRVFLVSHKYRESITRQVEAAEIEVVRIQTAKDGSLNKGSLRAVGTLPLETDAPAMELVHKNETRLTFQAANIEYRLDSASLVGLGMRVQIRAERDGASFRDKLDLAVAAQRRGFAKNCGMRLGVSANDVEQHLSAMADRIDAMLLEQSEVHSRTARKLGKKEEEEALNLLRQEDMLEVQAHALEEYLHFIGEEHNKRVAILVAASRLLSQPLGAILSGPAGCGKSALIQAVSRLLPMHQVLYFSRLTPQALYFMPRDQLQNSLLLCDEYAGLEDSEYALRTMMSQQALSLAITLREGGRVPVTRTVEIPVTVAVLVSTTGKVNIENLSRFIELRLDASSAQNRRVMQGMAAIRIGRDRGEGNGLALLQNAGQLLRPCRVQIPYAEQLIYQSDNVLARRQFAHVVGLISAHAALHQYQRETATEDHTLIVQATRDDYRAVYSLFAHLVMSNEELVSPAASELLGDLQKDKTQTITIRQAMERMGWSYSKCYRTLGELARLALVQADRDTIGVTRIYAVAPYTAMDNGIHGLPVPENL